MDRQYADAIYWVEVDRINPNPFQPRRNFNDDQLNSLAESIRAYGVLQPLVVTRKEDYDENGGMTVSYELIAGERRLRASRIAGLTQVPVVIRAQEETDKMKLELAIIENLQREDINAIDRAVAFKKLVDDFAMKHTDIAKKIGKSREFVSNTLRLLALPEHIQQAVIQGAITEGHTRPLLMLTERPDEQETLFKEVTMKKLTVRETERIARRIATDRARKKELTPELISLERELTESLGTRVQIEQRDKGGKVHIDFFSPEDLKDLLKVLSVTGVAATVPEAIESAVESNAWEMGQNALPEEMQGTAPTMPGFVEEQPHEEEMLTPEVAAAIPEPVASAPIEQIEEKVEFPEHHEEQTEVTQAEQSMSAPTSEQAADPYIPQPFEGALSPQDPEPAPVVNEAPAPASLEPYEPQPVVPSMASAPEPAQEVPQDSLAAEAVETETQTEDASDDDLYSVRNFNV